MCLALGIVTLVSVVPRTFGDQAVKLDPARVQAIAQMLPEHPQGIGPPISDRQAWQTVAKRSAMKSALSQAQKLLKTPLPPTTDDLYLETSRTGNRSRWQNVSGQRRGRICPLVLAECLENKGRFITPFKETMESICQERTWVMPAHDLKLLAFEGKRQEIDLASAAMAWEYATACWLLDDRLDPATQQLIREQVRRRVLDPFRQMLNGQLKPSWWLTGDNNWNAVCLAGVTGAALTLVESRQERAEFVAAAETLSKHFLSGIPADGYCTEGVGYWNYGFGHYVMLAETLMHATDNQLDLLEGEHVRRAAMYGLNVEIAPGVFPTFSDCSMGARPADWLIDFISQRWGQSNTPLAKSKPTGTLYHAILLSFPEQMPLTQHASADLAKPGIRYWFEQSGVFIGRPGTNKDCQLHVALKGGHNAEEHNHNDLGSYIVVVDGRNVLVDPGSEVYTARTFSSRRYESKVLNSLGHPVPMVAGQLQSAGRKFQAKVIRTDFTDDADTIVLDLKAGYNVPSLRKLERTFLYSRQGNGSLTVRDEFAFAEPQAFGTALITFGQWHRSGEDRLRIEDDSSAVEVAIHAEGFPWEIQAEALQEDLTCKRIPTRISLDSTASSAAGVMTLTITPARQPSSSTTAVTRE